MNRSVLDRIDRGLAAFLKWFMIACLVCLLCLVAAGVFVRFVPVSSMGWADEIIHLGFAWIVFLGAVLLWRDGTHFRVDLIPGRLAGSRSGQVLEIALSILSFIFFLVLAYEGFLLISRTTDRSPILDLPQLLWYLVVPVSAVLMLCYTARDILKIFLSNVKSVN